MPFMLQAIQPTEPYPPMMSSSGGNPFVLSWLTYAQETGYIAVDITHARYTHKNIGQTDCEQIHSRTNNN